MLLSLLQKRISPLIFYSLNKFNFISPFNEKWSDGQNSHSTSKGVIVNALYPRHLNRKIVAN